MQFMVIILHPKMVPVFMAIAAMEMVFMATAAIGMVFTAQGQQVCMEPDIVMVFMV